MKGKQLPRYYRREGSAAVGLDEGRCCSHLEGSRLCCSCAGHPKSRWQVREAASQKCRAEEDSTASRTRVRPGPATGFGEGEGERNAAAAAALEAAEGCEADPPCCLPSGTPNEEDAVDTVRAALSCARPLVGLRALRPPSSKTVSKGRWSLSAKSAGEGQVESGRDTGRRVE